MEANGKEQKFNKRTPLVNKRQLKENKRMPKSNKKNEVSNRYVVKASKEEFTEADKKKRRRRRLILCLCILIVLFVFMLIFYVFYNIRQDNIFAQSSAILQDEIDNPIFRIEKIYVYSGVNVEDTSRNKNLANVNISQFTDFAIYIDNHLNDDSLTEENTVNNLYIDNIAVSGVSLGTQKVNYKNVDSICIYKKLSEGTSRIDYSVLHTNKEKEENRKNNVFYTDCTEPFIMSYVNENIVEGENLSETEEVFTLDGSILEYFGIKATDLNYEISFTINIENNFGEVYKCDCSLDIDLSNNNEGLNTGYIMQIYDFSGQNRTFRKVND